MCLLYYLFLVLDVAFVESLLLQYKRWIKVYVVFLRNVTKNWLCLLGSWLLVTSRGWSMTSCLSGCWAAFWPILEKLSKHRHYEKAARLHAVCSSWAWFTSPDLYLGSNCNYSSHMSTVCVWNSMLRARKHSLPAPSSEVIDIFLF